jgi:hypothetical protein
MTRSSIGSAGNYPKAIIATIAHFAAKIDTSKARLSIIAYWR